MGRIMMMSLQNQRCDVFCIQKFVYSVRVSYFRLTPVVPAKSRNHHNYRVAMAISVKTSTSTRLVLWIILAIAMWQSTHARRELSGQKDIVYWPQNICKKVKGKRETWGLFFRDIYPQGPSRALRSALTRCRLVPSPILCHHPIYTVQPHNGGLQVNGRIPPENEPSSLSLPR